jgi:hypothetical protein
VIRVNFIDSQQQNIPNMDPPPYDSQKPPPYPTDEKFGSYPPSWSPYGDNAQQTGNASMPHNPPRPPHMQQPHGHPVAVVFVNSGEPTSFIGEPIVAETFARQMCLACIVMWCCNCLFGLMAYILASEYCINGLYLHIERAYYCGCVTNFPAAHHDILLAFIFNEECIRPIL